MFDKILIANRGEIACRIIRTARRLGIRTVAIYSEADQGALHVEMADEALAVGPAPAAQSYLDSEAIIRACRASGAQAVHPGYGFLSERAEFARALAQAGIAFIGPNADAIAAMGDKIQSKRIAQAANVSTVPGFIGAIQSSEEAVARAQEIGYPVMVKASAGGGGKGMRIAHASEDVPEAFARAASEARSSFGDDRVFIEKFIVDPRHIEIQVLADRHGNIVYLGERECSIQRRHQKIVEESPSPLVDETMRRRMGEQAVALAKSVGYDSAGTVEFVAAQDRSFYFLEMNTRLQVEHPVTEFVTGLDLVEQMIRIACGEPLTIQQKDVHLRGWAVETRIYAEDPSRDFLPSAGRLSLYRPPPDRRHEGASVRIDTGVCEGSEISLFYDPLIAKVVTHAGDRALAIQAQADALDSFVIEGVQNNLSFLSGLMQSERWRAGRLSTSFIGQEYPDGWRAREPAGEAVHVLASVAAAADHVMNERKRQISGQLPTQRPVAFSRSRSVLIGSSRLDVIVEDADDALIIRFCEGGHAHQARSNWTPGEPLWKGSVDDEQIAVKIAPVLNGFAIAHRGVSLEARVYTRREADLASLMAPRTREASSKLLVCPMPGLVRSLLVKPGQSLKAGEAVCVVEAMKMENVLRAERDGTVAEILVEEGASLAVDAPVLSFE